MAKYLKKQKKHPGRAVLAVVLALLIAAGLWVANLLRQEKIPVLEQEDLPVQTEAPETQPAEPEETAGVETVYPEETEPQPMELSEGLVIHTVAGYAGMYMEDGTNEVVSDVMMILLENTSGKDLQLARITLEYTGVTAQFEVTNLPAGERVVVLEKSRQSSVAGKPETVKLSDVVFFPEPMGLAEDKIRITGSNGSLEVENISGEDIAGDIYIYYKHSASDLLYGGITFRVSVKGGLAAGESARVIAGHYMPDNSRLVLVDCGA